MKIYQAKDDADLVDQLIEMVEANSGKKIFTMRVLDHTADGLESLIVFEDQSILMGLIKVEGIGGKLALRIQANYV
jgi:Holliday junction resolvasome RuvABC DNA-binding subunit